MSMEVTTKHRSGIPVIKIEGQIDMGNYVEVHEMILSEIKHGHPNIVLNFRRLEFMDSATIGMLLRSLDKTKQQGGLLALVTNPHVDRILSAAGLASLFKVFAEEDSAINSLPTSGSH